VVTVAPATTMVGGLCARARAASQGHIRVGAVGVQRAAHQGSKGQHQARKGELVYASTDTSVVNVDDLKAIVVAVEYLVDTVNRVDIDAARVPMRFLGDGPKATNLTRTATLETNPAAIGVKIHVEYGAVALNAGGRIDGKNLLDHQKVPPATPPVKLPVPTIARPVADSVDLKTPRIAMLNSPEAARYTPVVVSAEKFSDGAPTEPLFKLILEEPARTVFALNKLTESQTSVA